MSPLLLVASRTGKTWLLEQELWGQLLIRANLLEKREFLTYQSQPELLRQAVEGAVKKAA